MDEELQRLARKANEASTSADIDIEVERLFRARERANLCRVCGVPEPGDIGICVPCRERVFKALLRRRSMYDAIFGSRDPGERFGHSANADEPGITIGHNATVSHNPNDVVIGTSAPMSDPDPEDEDPNIRQFRETNSIRWSPVPHSCRPCGGIGTIQGRRCNTCLGGGTARL